MAITYQFNKTSLQSLEKDLKMRQRTLPTLQNKETALRLEVKKAKQELADLDEEVNRRIRDYDQMIALWGEFDTSLIHVDDVRMSIKKIAGVRVPVLDEVVYSTKEFSLFSSPKWFADGFEQLKAIADVGIRQEFVRRKVDLLEYARKKTTQKVNLFEKVQIPGYQDAIRKIKRFMEDEENLSKSSQKIVKGKREAEARLAEQEARKGAAV
ncbi:MAG: V-type ATP synthase subunit D [Paludibacteraceae bacterium]|nr:V-type ATP synthase subunit D [Paludibacteraceae bacterium]